MWKKSHSGRIDSWNVVIVPHSMKVFRLKEGQDYNIPTAYPSAKAVSALQHNGGKQTNYPIYIRNYSYLLFLKTKTYRYSVEKKSQR